MTDPSVWLTSGAHVTVTGTSASTFDAIVPLPPNETVSGPSIAPAAPAQTTPTASTTAATISKGRRFTFGVSAAYPVAASLTSGNYSVIATDASLEDYIKFWDEYDHLLQQAVRAAG